MSSRDEDDGPLRRRLRVPVSLTVALVGSSAAMAMWYGGCHPGPTDPIPDAGRIDLLVDAAPLDSIDAGDDASTPDAPRDAPPPDSPPT